MIILSDDVENKSFPIVNSALIAANVAVFAWVLGCGFGNHQAVVDEWGTVPARFILNHGVHDFTAIGTSMFMHGGWMHLLGNMWILFLFGDNVEDRLGHCGYLIFYLTCGLFADLLHIFAYPFSAVPCIGASGAIAGVMGAYIAMHPSARCKTWFGDDAFFFAFRTYQVPAYFIIGGWFALQVLCQAYLPEGSSNVAFCAHIGGFLAGIGLLTFLNYKQYDQSPEGGTPGWDRGICAIAFATFLCMSYMMINNYLKTEVHAATTAPAQVKPVAASGKTHKMHKVQTAQKSKSSKKQTARKSINDRA